MTQGDGPPPLRNDRPLVVCLALAVALAFAVATQYAAWRLGFHPRLGSPLFIPSPASQRIGLAASVICAGAGLSMLLFRHTRRLAGIPFILALAALASG